VFPGQYYDQETGLHYNWFRYYDPQTDRYITSDPVGLAGGLNTYLYALANPLRYTDPTGRFIFLGIPAWAWATGGAAAGAGVWWGFNNPSAVNSDVHVGPWPGSSTAGDSEEAGEDAADEIRDEDGICPPSDNQDRCRDAIKKCRQKCIDKSAPGARANTSEWIGRCVLSCTASMGCGNYIP